MGFWSAIVGGRRGWRAARYERRVSQIEALGPALRLRSDEELSAASLTLRQRARSGEPLDALLVEAFALGREASARVLGMRPFDVQLQGG
ncbi:MAG: hypothetical protein KC609_24885, partial [Myxococcales bacterium]|nr:hypothetical protein [Myxococcales bacterium]